MPKFREGWKLAWHRGRRGSLFYYSLNYIKLCRPRVAIMENVSNLYQQFHDVYKQIVQLMEGMGYVVCTKKSPLVNTCENGLPQSRRRMILVCVRRDTYVVMYKAPKKLPYMVKLSALVVPSASAGELPPIGNPKRQRVKEAYKKAVRAGYDPRVDVVVTDVDASDRFQHSMVNKMPCVTATRGKSHGFHVSTTRHESNPWCGKGELPLLAVIAGVLQLAGGQSRQERGLGIHIAR